MDHTAFRWSWPDKLSPARTDAEKHLAWTAWVQLATTITNTELDEGSAWPVLPGYGAAVARHLLGELHAMQPGVWQAVADAGPHCAPSGRADSVAALLSNLMSTVMSPFLIRWRPVLHGHTAHIASPKPVEVDTILRMARDRLAGIGNFTALNTATLPRR
jgi:hypothetical protein